MIPVLVIPFLNRADLVARCIGSIDFPVERLIIIDNSGHGGVFGSKFVKNVSHWRMPSNLCVATSWNLGIKSTPFASGWILLNSDAWFEKGALEQFYSECHKDEILLCGSPGWACAWIGENVVAKVGLFCENFFPAYFEDSDYERRVRAQGFTVKTSSAIVYHENSSTLAASEKFRAKNGVSFAANQALYNSRDASSGAGEWDLGRRRALGWD